MDDGGSTQPGPDRTAPDEQQLREQVCEIGRNLWRKDMVAANDGNITVRLGPDRFLATPTGTSKGYLRPELLVVVDAAGRPEPGCPVRPSSELPMHLRVYARRPDVGAVVHAHPMYATVWAVAGEGLPRQMLPETVVAMGPVPLAPYATPSTNAVPDSIEPFLTGAAVLLEQHGALTWGPDLMSAYLAMERLEYTAKISYLLRRIGAERDLPAAEIARLKERFGTTY
ncbi:MAG: class II aldolase/adducin family protein [Austwickia sp.]|nr:class II aldolase/adducin family protein [Austwickia sp.]